ncbi:hypothetical protein GE775_18415 [Salmonella enterica]|nr:hypothetical protein [Salmonella enterica]
MDAGKLAKENMTHPADNACHVLFAILNVKENFLADASAPVQVSFCFFPEYGVNESWLLGL